MKKLYPFVFVFVLICISSAIHAQCVNGRYYNKNFAAASHLNVPYGSAIKFDGSTQNLSMDIFEPKNDNFAHRPLIILAFGGSFTSGLKESPDMLQLCNEFAQRGYVTATIDYRIGVENGDDSCIYKAVIRGIQDMNAAIRFFYKDVYTANQYRIDTSQIFIGGTSAGAFIGINKAYGKVGSFSRDIPPYFLSLFLELGQMEGNSGNPGYSDKVKGVIDLCGAVMDTLWIQPGDPILVGVHGTADGTVPFYFDSIAGTQDIKKNFYGGGDIINRYNHIGLNAYIHPFPGADHVPFILPIPLLPPASKYMDTTIQVIRDFLARNVVCDSTTTGIDEVAAAVSVSAFPNPSDESITIASHEYRDMTVRIFNLEGQLLKTELLPANSEINISKNDVGSGMYIMNVYDKGGEKRFSTDKIVFY